MHYLRWAKTHERAKFEMTISGVPPVETHELSDQPLRAELQVRGGYGDPTLIDRIAQLYAVPRDYVIPVPGTSSANFIAMAASADHGDWIMIETPRYDPLERAAEFLGLRILPLVRRAENRFDIELDQIETGLKGGAKAIVLSNLHNPSGQGLSRDSIERIVAMCARYDATLIVDEVYLDAVHLTTGQPRWSAASVGENVIATGSLTKVYGLGGLRAGWMLASGRHTRRLCDLMDLLSVENPGPVASIATFSLSRMEFLENRYRTMHDAGKAVFGRWLADEPLVRCHENAGALFEWVKLPDGMDGSSLHELLVSDYDTQIVPGRFFGDDRHVRIGLTIPAEDIEEGLSRVGLAIRAIRDRAVAR